jgi:hypothetical protein
MKIQGKIYKIRPYEDSECHNFHYIGFLESDDGIQLDGQTIKIIPLLIEELWTKELTIEKVEVDGDIEFKQIITLSGKRSFYPVPTLQVRTIAMVS